MATVEISVEGLALWIRRNAHWEVLFPMQAGVNDQHLPYLTVETDGEKKEDRVPLAGRTLASSDLVPGEAPSSDVPSWMLRLSAAANSGPANKQPASHDGVVASLMLPLQKLEPKGDANIGNVNFNGRDYLLAYGTRLRLTCGESPSLRLSSKGSSDPINEIQLAKNASRILVRIENLTDSDSSENCGETKKGEHLLEADDLLTLCEMQVPVPRYFGLDLKGVCVRAGLLRSSTLVENPFRLCPHGYCEDCPAD